LEVSGVVSGALLKKTVKQDIDLTMMSFGSITNIQNQKTDNLGKFYFPLPDEFGEKIDVLIQSKKNKSKKNSEYNFTLDNRVSPFLKFRGDLDHSYISPEIKYLLEQNQVRRSVETAFRLEDDGIDLDEVIVTGTKLSPEREKVYKSHGEPDIVIDGADIRANEKKWSFGLYSILKFSFPKDILINTDLELQAGGGLRAKVIGGGNADVVLIDGILIQKHEYQFLESIPPSEVTSVEIIKFADEFLPLWWALGNLDMPDGGNIIAIFTQSAKGLYGAYPRIGFSEFSIPVFALAKEFYTPKYENLSPESWIKPDLRALIDWKRSLNTTEGKVSTSYYNGDLTGDVRVIIEAISKQGKIGYYEFDYKVRERTEKK